MSEWGILSRSKICLPQNFVLPWLMDFCKPDKDVHLGMPLLNHYIAILRQVHTKSSRQNSGCLEST